ncbi:MAG: tRNA (N(6)-L-threonylcarbamoyladenosine(37)-C(2))-methylthiotransferase MtaB [Treponema sp.]|jgi:threonylcarbamoyladenosine tRNA methylthiotransferase MtaB|nr:tRNA (N(6)-L-threonylcarbamoyladenosine(37)-C(2))-methylthiotransferase MtaB [Treponema sp.]
MYSVAFYTLGCKLNQLESEALADSFRKAGFFIVPSGTPIPEPGIIIINTCTVTSKADQKSRRLIRKALRENPDSCVIVTGCYAQLDSTEIELLETEAAAGVSGNRSFDRRPNDHRSFDRRPFSRRLFVLGGGRGDSSDSAGAVKSAVLELPEYVLKATASMPESPLSGGLLPKVLETWIEQAKGEGPFSFKPEEFSFHSRGYLKIQDGCDNGCSYCRVYLARGNSVSLPREAALAELRSFEGRGCAELMITGVNITQYNHCGLGLAGLLECLLEGSASIALRLASLEPEGINEKLVSVLAHPRIRPHFHLSVQSGSDTVLQRMGRAYRSQTVEQGAALLRSVKDNPFLACDIIAGFPGETEAEFEETLNLCEKIGFAWIHAFPYSKRPGTKAFSLKNPVCEREVTRRVEALNAAALRGRRDYAQAWLGRELSAIVEKAEPDSAGRRRAVTENYLKVLVNCSADYSPGSSLRCVPVSLCAGADGEQPDAIAVTDKSF